MNESTADISEQLSMGTKAKIQVVGKKFPGDHHEIQWPKEHFIMQGVQLRGCHGAATSKVATPTDKLGVSVSDGTCTVSALVESIWPSHSVSIANNEVLLDFLVQILYSALCFDSTGLFRTCGSGQAASRPETSTSIGGTSTKPRKRRLESDRDDDSDQNDDNGRKSRRVKNLRLTNDTPETLRRRFACLHCKRKLEYANETNCAGWSNPNIDTVLRVSRLFSSVVRYSSLRRRIWLTWCSATLKSMSYSASFRKRNSVESKS